jgi:hypothetical protein
LIFLLYFSLLLISYLSIFIYNPQRLQVVSPCKSVLGVIESKRVEKDGDYHIRVKLDPPFSNLINSANIKNQLGDLVVEPICMNPVTQADAVSL